MLMLMIILLIMFVTIMIYMIFILISYFKDKENELMMGYECGFEFMSKTRMYFSYRFFLLALLFLIFDVEVVLFLMVPYLFGSKGMWLMMYMMGLLLLGLVYEWALGSLDWL